MNELNSVSQSHCGKEAGHTKQYPAYCIILFPMMPGKRQSSWDRQQVNGSQVLERRRLTPSNVPSFEDIVPQLRLQCQYPHSTGRIWWKTQERQGMYVQQKNMYFLNKAYFNPKKLAGDGSQTTT